MNKEHRDLLFFGYGLGAIAGIFGMGGILKHGFHIVSAILLACCLIFVVVTALDWKALRLGYMGWMKVAHLIGGIVTTVILTLVFFLVFTPFALVLKLFGKDYLERNIDRAVKSYWHARLAVNFEKERYLQQF